MADQVTRTEFTEYMQAFEERLNQRTDVRLTDSMQALEERLTQRMDVQFEETRALIRLSLEGLQMLRESTDRGFADVRSQLDENTDLLQIAVKHIRGRVERLERK